MKKIILILFIMSTTKIMVGQSRQMDYYKATLKYLASDELEGRLAGMKGEKKSAQYIKNEFKLAGLAPAASDTSYIQQFPYTFLRLATPQTHLMITNKAHEPLQQALNIDFVLVSESADTAMAFGEVFDARYGIIDKERNMNDYKNFDHKRDSGKVFIIQLGDGSQKEATNNMASFYLQEKIKNAIAHFAGGIIFINPDGVAIVPSGEFDKSVVPSKIPIFYCSGFKGKSSDILVAEMYSNVAHVRYYGNNVIAQRFRSHKKKYLVIAANHDGIGRGDMGNSATQEQEIHNGANANASGVAMMLHLANTIPKKWAFRKYNLLFVAYSGKELGLLGSKFMLQDTFIDTSKILAVVNLDGVGRLNKIVTINDVGTSNYWVKQIDKIKVDTSVIQINAVLPCNAHSDNFYFNKATIPSVNITTGEFEEYNTPKDDEYLINYEGMVNIENYLVKLMCKYPKKVRGFKSSQLFE